MAGLPLESTLYRRILRFDSFRYSMAYRLYRNGLKIPRQIWKRRLSEAFPHRLVNRSHSLLHPLPPLPSTPPKRVVFGSCSCQTEDLSFWDRILEWKPDVVLLLGDNVYGKDLRMAYATYADQTSAHRGLKDIPVLAVLDDNDYGKDKDLGTKIFCDFWDIQDERRRPGRGVYTSHIWGDRLQVIMLDVRYHASPFKLRKISSYEDDYDDGGGLSGPFLPDKDPSSTFLGVDQWRWLEKQIDAQVQWRLVVSPIQVLPRSTVGTDGTCSLTSVGDFSTYCTTAVPCC